MATGTIAARPARAKARRKDATRVDIGPPRRTGERWERRYDDGHARTVVHRSLVPFVDSPARRRPVTTEFGSRVDRFDAAGAIAVDPRAAVRVTLGSRSSVRVAAGRYHQFPSPTYLDAERGADSLAPMVATHLVAGFEYGSPHDPFFARVEVYRKWYGDLPLEDPD